MIGQFSVFWFLTGYLILLPHFVCTLILDKRKYFALRSAAGILLYSVAAYLTTFTDQLNERYYLLLHLAACLYLVWCCRCSVRMYFYFNIWCITIYYLVFQVTALLNSAIDIASLTHSYLRLLLNAALLALLTFWIIRALIKKGAADLHVSHVLISGLISASVITLNTISYSIRKEDGLIIFLFQVFSMLCTMLAMYILAASFFSQRKASESEYFKYILRASRQDYELRAEYIDMINRKYHDLKHELRVLRQMDSPTRNARIDEIESSIDEYSNLFQTGNEALDVILNEQRRRCEKEKVMFSCIANCSGIDFIDMIDLNILLGNMFENAFEAVSGLPEENRVLDVKIHTDDHFLRITEKNTFSGELTYTKDGLVSTKPEKGYHGFGSRSMKYIVERYKGQLAFDTEDNVFKLHIVIPLA
ncbi:MAG: sensor histidine kinase [Parasporobacterium sp.]|nr:sensor histidine kinase [Parasporobacterium sp.]